ncbi:MAG TPA: hypothetical protein VF636_05070 [Sphingomonas sp.]
MRSVCWLAASILPLQPTAARELAVVNQPERTLQLVDGERGAVLLTVALGERPHEVEVSPDGRFAYAPIYGNGAVGRPGTDGDTVEVVGLASGRVNRIALGAPVRPHDAKFGPDGLLYVTAETAQAVLVVDVATGRVVGRVPTGRPESHSLAISPDGRRAYTANVGSGSVSVLDLIRRRLIGVVPVASMVQRVTVSADGRRLFTHDQRAPRVVEIDAGRMKVVASHTLPGLPYASAISPDGRTLIVAGRPELPGQQRASPSLYLLDLRSSSVETIRTPGWPRVVAVDGATGLAWLNFGSGEIASLDLRTKELLVTARLGPGLDGMSLLPR